MNLYSHIVNDLGADTVYELVMALEEEFDIEITDEEASDRLNLGSYAYYLFSGSSGGNCTVTGCEVKKVVDLIYKKLSA